MPATDNLKFRRSVLCLLSVFTFGILPNVNAQQAPPNVPEASLKALDDVVAHYVKNDLTVGAELLVIQSGKVLLHTSHGFVDKDDKRAWKVGTHCNIRSMTKPITSAAAQILIDSGQLKLDDPVSKYLASFDNDLSREITVRQVLTHRSGMPLTILLSPRQYKSLEEQVAASGERGPTEDPGKTFMYSDAGTDVVGRLVEKVTGESLDQFVEREILKPLDMNETFYGIDGNDKRLKGAASLYLGGPKKWVRFWKPDNKPLYPFAWGSQTLYSTTTDYAKFLTMMSNDGRVGDRQLLSKEAVQRMLHPTSLMAMPGTDTAAPTGFLDVKPFYGQMMVTHREVGEDNKPKLGVPRVLGHSGSDGTNAWTWPDRQLTIIYFTQSRGGSTPIRIEEHIERLLIHPDRVSALSEVPSRLKPYVGIYIANFKSFQNEEMTVRVFDGKLMLDIPSQQAFELLEPDKSDRWAFAIRPDRVSVSFVRDDKDHVIALHLHQGDQTFTAPRKGHTLAEEKTDSAAKMNVKDLPKADDIISRYIEVTGGEAAYRALTSSRLIGEVSIPSQNLTGKLETVIASNGKFFSKTEFENVGFESAGSDGTTVWNLTSFTGATLLDDMAREKALFNHNLQARLQNDFYKTVKTTGQEPVLGEDCYRIESVGKDDETLVEYFSAKSGLLIKEIRQVDSPAGKLKVASYFKDYQKVDKFTLPFQIEQDFPGDTKLFINYSKIELNSAVPENQFKLPVEVQKLLKD
jgi:CubicO group peptidase (beta-lactamase class C family)